MNQNITGANTSPQLLTPPPAKTPTKLLVLAVLLFLFGGLGGYLIGSNKVSLPKVNKPSEVACTMEAKICPDGSSVGRSGPNCEFTPCPSAQSTTPATANWNTYKNSTIGFEIKFPPSWKEIEHSSNFYNYASYQAPDQSSVEIYVAENETSSLEEYVIKTAKEAAISWEGKPSLKTISQKNTSVGDFGAIEREEEMLAAGFKVLTTYFKAGTSVYRIRVLPNSDNSLLDTEAYKNYHQILSTFKFLDN